MSNKKKVNKLYDIFIEGIFFGKGENVTDDATIAFTMRGTLDKDEIKRRLERIVEYYKDSHEK